jgi:tripartite ATP-independent transporter DctP family solute receptor
MKKLFTVGLAVAFGVAFALTPNGTEARELKFAHQSNVTNINHLSQVEFQKMVAELTGGDITIRIFPNKQLGGERDEIEGILLGTLDGAKPASAVVANWVPEFNVANMPFVFRDLDHFQRVWRAGGELHKIIQEKAEAKGLRFLCALTTGVRNIMSKRPIFGIEDMKGLKIRAIENPVHVATFNAMGANATAIAYPEVYGALQTGVVDGADAANNNYHSQKFYEQAPYWSLIGWLVFTNTMIMSEKTWDSLSAKHQKAVQDAAFYACNWQTEYYKTDGDKKLQLLLAKGVKVTVPYREPFIEASQKVYEEFLKTDEEKGLVKLIQGTE